jgi:DNA repair exonuclease SbcCD ATPase subunit
LEILRQAADNNQQAEQTIRAWVDEYRSLAGQLSELKKAEKEIGDLRSKYSTLDEQIKAFPDEVQQAQSKVVDKELQVKKKERADKKTEHGQWQKKAWEETERLSRKQDLQKEHKRLITEEEDFRDLATLLEPPGPRSAGGPLLQEIMRDALKNVAKRASEILDEWSQSTQIIIPQDALEFKVIDLASGSSERHYQLFSGGEKFMVALAMALAIGEVASDTGHTDCLFIDEGFGLLDKENRAYVAQEIVNKLVSSGRRKQVVVITHMEDIQEAFPDRRSRYHLINDGTATQLLVGEDDAST